MSETTCARSGGAVLCVISRVCSDRALTVRVAMQVAQLELELIAKKVLPERAHFIARLQMQKFSTAPSSAQRRT